MDMGKGEKERKRNDKREKEKKVEGRELGYK
jgi:hypothetical protein